MKKGTFSLGIGDRFAMQAKAQLTALQRASRMGIQVIPVWNKSNREHTTVHSDPEETRIAADTAVKEMNWKEPYFVDADHINLSNVDKFIPYCDFFTLDVAEYINKTGSDAELSAFIQASLAYTGDLKIPGIQAPFQITKSQIELIASKYGHAIARAGELYRHILGKKGDAPFITEVSMDEVDSPQTPVELFFILLGLGLQRIPLETIAPKFTGRFNKGVDYIGDLQQFELEFEQDLLVIKDAVQKFGLPESLKLSVHSGSDKFSLYPIIRKYRQKYQVGIHLKTAGTTWLEEVTGLALAGGDSLELAKKIYLKALDRFDELTGPYATVIDIDKSKLPSPETVKQWTPEQYANSLRHESSHPLYNPSFRQLLHVAYKIAAEYSNIYVHAIKSNEEIVGQQVTGNLLEKHILRIAGI